MVKSERCPHPLVELSAKVERLSNQTLINEVLHAGLGPVERRLYELRFLIHV